MAAAVIRPRTGAGMETDKTKFLAGMSHDKELQQVDYEKIAAGAADFRVREDSDKKTVLLKDLLHSDLKAADLKWSFFVSACYSYKCDSCSKPFPPMYIKNENKDIEAVVWILLFIYYYFTISQKFVQVIRIGFIIVHHNYCFSLFISLESR